MFFSVTFSGNIVYYTIVLPNGKYTKIGLEMLESKTPCIEIDTKHRIFMVAARLFAEKGFHAVSMREISEESGVSKPMIYYYFSSKEGIYKALIDQGLEYSRESLKNIYVLPVSTREKLVEFVHKKFADAVAYPEFTKFYITLFISSEKLPFLDTSSAEAIKQSQFLTQIIEDAIKTGELAPRMDPRFVVEVLSGSVLHFLWHQIKGIEPKATRQLAENLVDLLLEGMKNNKDQAFIDC